jgi:hypothetical protein
VRYRTRLFGHAKEEFAVAVGNQENDAHAIAAAMVTRSRVLPRQRLTPRFGTG